ncbi:MAG: hypothetical protein LKE46_16485 [Clostridium sp.]|jgi:DNA/RNA-binding domain of Phe-tRNA-synthetase-like protein|uniref:phenylalanine--tRNA ligase beta subunit-related protein n=1 Tax=Clostridium sp. TaxID=1506 RepID=UPI0025C4DFB2|nr:phenylalanine--tRNA ligase beta subunit-related protein [Clostridium sp.]MCH3965812.1 hypothetical protein [Clostridium sp.]MCI1716099.1 hypothetical protein [Clostridium sp.]MCI1800229.1 hypothetical protein [Clostridium sp.]MCI1814276.1 hypothetical protein [Clostridium sp.]MCI1871175.1 hypothetical protein [Clostridium sp.]
MIEIHPNMNNQYQNTFFGILVLQNFYGQPGRKDVFSRFTYDELESIRSSHSNYDRKAFCKTDEVVNPYVRYYKKFKKTYHVLLQLESILNGKDFPDAIPLVQALFMTELKTSLLIAGHDLKKCHLPLTIQMSKGGETCLGAGNRGIVLKPKDICLRDQKNYILSIIYGQDDTTRITEKTTDVLFLIDGVPGLDKCHIEKGLETLLRYVRVFAPDTVPIDMRVIGTSAMQGGENQ